MGGGRVARAAALAEKTPGMEPHRFALRRKSHQEKITGTAALESERRPRSG
jgi:hypothetical protein